MADAVYLLVEGRRRNLAPTEWGWRGLVLGETLEFHRMDLGKEFGEGFSKNCFDIVRFIFLG